MCDLSFLWVELKRDFQVHDSSVVMCCVGAEKKIVFQQISNLGILLLCEPLQPSKKSIKMLISTQRRHVVFTAVIQGSYCKHTQCSRPQSAVCNTAWANLAVAFNCVGQTNVFVCIRVHIRVCVCEGQVEDGCRKHTASYFAPQWLIFFTSAPCCLAHTHTHTH